MPSAKCDSRTSKVKDMFESEMREARSTIEETGKDRRTAELRAQQAEDEAIITRRRYVRSVGESASIAIPPLRYECLRAANESDRENIQVLQTQLRDNEADRNLFQRRLSKLPSFLVVVHRRLLLDPSRSGR